MQKNTLSIRMTALRPAMLFFVVTSLSCMAIAGAKQQGNAQLSLLHNGIAYEVFEKRMDTICAINQKNNTKFWETTILAVSLLKEKESYKQVNQIIANIDIEDNTLHVITEFGDSYHINLKNGAIRQSGSFIFNKEEQVSLDHAIDETNCVEYVLKKMTIKFNKDDLRQMAIIKLENNAQEILDFLEQKGINQKGIATFSNQKMYDFFHEKKSYFDIKDPQEKLLWSNYLELERILKELIYQGKCLIYDKTREDKIGRMAVLFWEWTGCGGKCIQVGRIFCTMDYKTVISRTTDRFEDL